MESNANNQNKTEEKPSKINKLYCKSFRGILRLAIIILLIPGWISAAAANTLNTTTICVGDCAGYSSSRNAYLVLAVLAQIISILIFLIYLFNIDKFKCCNSVNFNLITLITDSIFLIIMFALGITCSVREANYGSFANLSTWINQGAFGSAAFFAFTVFVLYSISWVLEFIHIRSKTA